MIAIEFAVILIFLALAAFIMTRFFVKHSRRKNDPLMNDLDMIFFRDQNKIKRGK
jgi:hypothetical protein